MRIGGWVAVRRGPYLRTVSVYGPPILDEKIRVMQIAAALVFLGRQNRRHRIPVLIEKKFLSRG